MPEPRIPNDHPSDGGKRHSECFFVDNRQRGGAWEVIEKGRPMIKAA
jgi:hypothetical protein